MHLRPSICAAACVLWLIGCSEAADSTAATGAGSAGTPSAGAASGGSGGSAGSGAIGGSVVQPVAGTAGSAGGTLAGTGSSGSAVGGNSASGGLGGAQAGAAGAGGAVAVGGTGGTAGGGASAGAGGTAGGGSSAGAGGTAGALGSAGSAGTAGAANDPQAIDVFLIAGQSNATGQGYVRNLPSGFRIDARVRLYHSGTPHLNSGSTPNRWIPLRQASESPDRFGPELGFGNRIQAFYPTRKVAIIKHAHSGTNLFSQWAPGPSKTSRSGWGEQFIALVDTVTPALAALKNEGLRPIVRGMLWQQGEADADVGGAAADNYGKNLVAFIGRVREQFDAPGMLFVYGYVYPPPNQGANIQLVRRRQSEVDAASGSTLATVGAFVVVTDDLQQRADDPGSAYPNDRLHFGSAGTLELGDRMAEKTYEKLGP